MKVFRSALFIFVSFCFGIILGVNISNDAWQKATHSTIEFTQSTPYLVPLK